MLRGISTKKIFWACPFIFLEPLNLGVGRSSGIKTYLLGRGGKREG